MPKFKRVFIIVLDSLGIGELPDAAEYGDSGSNTLASVAAAGLPFPNMQALGLYSIDGVDAGPKAPSPTGSFGRLAELSKGKDTTIGHWEIAGLISPHPLPTYPEGFPDEVVDALKSATGRNILCNRPYSGTEVIEEYGSLHMETGALIVYTSADSVLQIAAHESLIPPTELYDICRTAREVMQGSHGVGRIIARPFTGHSPKFTRTANRHDFSIPPPGVTLLDVLRENGLVVIGVGKIGDIFAGRGIGESYSTGGNRDGMKKAIEIAGRGFVGLCFINLVDFDMLYGHRNDPKGYAAALGEFDLWLPRMLRLLLPGDALFITADHGCDPGAPGTDHSREYVPLLITGDGIKPGVNLGTRPSFADISATVQEMLGLPVKTYGKSFLGHVTQK